MQKPECGTKSVMIGCCRISDATRVAPDTDLAGYPVLSDIQLNSNIEFFSQKNVPLFSFNKSAYRSLSYNDKILFVKTIFDFKQLF